MTAALIPARPLLKPWYRLARTEGGLVMEYGHRAVVFEGEATIRLVPALLPLLDGTRTVEQIVAVVGEAAAPAVENVVRLLGRYRLLTDPLADEAEVPDPAAEAGRFLAATAAADLSPQRALEALRSARVAVAGKGLLGAEVARLLALSGVSQLERRALDDGGGGAELSLVAPAAEELPELQLWNRRALECRSVWLLALPFDGRFAAVGPLFVAGETCCYECYRIRRASNIDYPEEFWTLEHVSPAHPHAPPLVAATAGLVATVAMRWLADADPLLPGVLFALEAGRAPRLDGHHVYRVPRCPACSDAERLAAPAPWFDGALLE